MAAARGVLESEARLRVDYLELRAEGDLEPLQDGSVTAGRLLVAASLGGVRLIDNLSLAEPPSVETGMEM